MKDGNVISVRMRGRLAGLGAATTVAATVTTLAMAGGAMAASASTGSVGSAGSASSVSAQAAVSAPAAAAYTPPKRTLKEGTKGADVKALQQRLSALKYYSGPFDGVFGNDTLEAVWAFQEVQGLGVDGVVGPATDRALVSPRAFHANDPRQAATRVEVNLKMHVLAFFRNHQVALISHVSTAGHYYYRCGSGSGTCYANTPTGEFHALYFVSGWDQGPLGAMYNPTFFNYSGYAIHGDTSVPVNPVSHGCVRIPMDIASWFYKNLTISETSGRGTQIWIYN
jgi:peptidoglycan hydrolase-like protein with peptidoglycan-binding domain